MVKVTFVRQTHEPQFLWVFMQHQWLLRKCSCGFFYGAKQGRFAKCHRCGSSKSAMISHFDDSKILADAVRRSNLPIELKGEISSRASKGEISPHVSDGLATNTSLLIRAMKKATGESGVITTESLCTALSSLNLENATADQLIGHAEAEGILYRSGVDEWTWL